MNKKIRKIIKTKWLIYLLVLIVTIPAIISLIRPGFFSMYDDMQVIRLHQMDACFRDFQIPCRWVPDLGYGYGYPLFQYYSPFPYYVMEIIHLMGFSFINSVKIGFVLSVVTSAVFFFMLARRFFSKGAALASMALYIYLPARLVDLYVRGAMGELWGLAILPAFFWGLDRLLEKRDIKRVVIFSIITSLFLTTHNLTVLMTTPVVILWVIFRIDTKRVRHDLKYYISAVLLSFGLASFYIIPLILERGIVHLDTLTSGYFYYVNHFLSLKQVLISMKWGYGPSIVGPNDQTSLSAGPLQAVFVMVGLVVVLISNKYSKQKYFWISLFLLYWSALFMTHSRSIFIWRALPFLSILQFPFRFLIIAGFVGALISGLVFNLIPKRYIKSVVLIFIILLISFYRQFLSPKDWFLLTDQEKLTGELYRKQITASIYDYLPKSAKDLPRNKAPEGLIIESGDVMLNETKRGTDWFYYDVDVKSNDADVTIPTYDFPKWEVYINGYKTDYKRVGDLGLLKVGIANGNNIIKVRLTKSVSRIVGDIITATSILLVGYVVFVKGRIWRKFIEK